jgi:hypothetical protein
VTARPTAARRLRHGSSSCGRRGTADRGSTRARRRALRRAPARTSARGPTKPGALVLRRGCRAGAGWRLGVVVLPPYRSAEASAASAPAFLAPSSVRPPLVARYSTSSSAVRERWPLASRPGSSAWSRSSALAWVAGRLPRAMTGARRSVRGHRLDAGHAPVPRVPSAAPSIPYQVGRSRGRACHRTADRRQDAGRGSRTGGGDGVAVPASVADDVGSSGGPGMRRLPAGRSRQPMLGRGRRRARRSSCRRSRHPGGVSHGDPGGHAERARQHGERRRVVHQHPWPSDSRASTTAYGSSGSAPGVYGALAE